MQRHRHLFPLRELQNPAIFVTATITMTLLTLLASQPLAAQTLAPRVPEAPDKIICSSELRICGCKGQGDCRALKGFRMRGGCKNMRCTGPPSNTCVCDLEALEKGDQIAYSQAAAHMVVGTWQYTYRGEQWRRIFTKDRKCTLIRPDGSKAWTYDYELKDSRTVVVSGKSGALVHRIQADGRLDIEGKQKAVKIEDTLDTILPLGGIGETSSFLALPTGTKAKIECLVANPWTHGCDLLRCTADSESDCNSWGQGCLEYGHSYRGDRDSGTCSRQD